MSKTSNQANAPLCAAFVESFRAIFGDVAVEYVSENEVVLGKKDEREYASCFFGWPLKNAA